MPALQPFWAGKGVSVEYARVFAQQAGHQLFDSQSAVMQRGSRYAIYATGIRLHMLLCYHLVQMFLRTRLCIGVLEYQGPLCSYQVLLPQTEDTHPKHR